MPKTKIKPTQVIPRDALKRMKDRPYYAFLYAKNILGGRLPEKVEQVFVHDPQSAYLYAKEIVKGKLPDFVHTAFVIGTFPSDESKTFVSKYLKEFCE
jgi:hypothetical protein